jgi:glc operon protein GlcG
MRKFVVMSVGLMAAAMFGPIAAAQQGPTPYGETINSDTAKKAVTAAIEESRKNGWGMCVAVTGPSGDLVHFERMDNCQFASIAISIHKAKAAATFRRPTKVFADAIAAAPGNVALVTLDGIIASEGGIPIVVGGKIVGAIGCSGATGQQDGVACTAGAGAVK